ncbi:hypothetical protein BH09PAT2_BH09PAT2_03280 [soil metagenome]
MHSIARATIIIPLIIIISAVILGISNHVSYQSESSKGLTISQTPPITETSVPRVTPDLKNISSKNVSLDLKGPLACFHKDKDQDIKLFVQNRQIYAKFTEKESVNHFLLQGDCLYRWQQGDKSGTKICNVGQYLTLAESFIKMPFFSPDLLFSFLPKMQGSSVSNITNNDLSMIMKSCQKVTLDEALFQIPRSVKFIEEKNSGAPEDLLK